MGEDFPKQMSVDANAHFQTFIFLKLGGRHQDDSHADPHHNSSAEQSP